ncbi:hypothetical protein ACQJBY_004138 [Aegilops geniculata]
MDSKKVLTDASLTDDLVVKILSRVPFKSFCRFKYVCKAWLAFSSDPHYRQKLPQIPTGLFHGCKGGSVAQLVSLSRNDEEIDGGLTFLPHHEHLKFVDCCNGLVLCKYKSNYIPPNICRFIVCNPATGEWRTLPDTHPDPYTMDYTYKAFLAFDPSWSAQFYVFNFQEKFDEMPIGINKLEAFSSDLSTWTVDAAWSPRLLQCAFPGESGDTAEVFSFDAHHSYEWSLKRRVSLRDALGRDVFFHNDEWPRRLGYRIAALDLERGVIILVDKEQMKLLSYNINTGKLRKIQDDCRTTTDYRYYVACYSKLPG